jgi:hypothetical protein
MPQAAWYHLLLLLPVGVVMAVLATFAPLQPTSMGHYFCFLFAFSRLRARAGVSSS